MVMFLSTGIIVLACFDTKSSFIKAGSGTFEGNAFFKAFKLNVSTSWCKNPSFVIKITIWPSRLFRVPVAAKTELYFHRLGYKMWL